MLRHVGKRFTVSRRVEKICDTIAATGSRRMTDTVYLEDLRCDGSGHDGCQAGLPHLLEGGVAAARRGGSRRRRAPQTGRTGSRRSSSSPRPARGRNRGARRRDTEVWRCQATEAFKASTPLKVRDLGQYWREVRSRQLPASPVRAASRPRIRMEVATRTRSCGPVPLTGDGTSCRAGARP